VNFIKIVLNYVNSTYTFLLPLQNNSVKLKPKKNEKLSFYLMIMVLSLCAVPSAMLAAEKVQLRKKFLLK
jgi:hypothetical protein